MDVFEAVDVKQSVEIDVQDFSRLVGDISRFLTVITQLRPFGEANIGIAEWVGLSAFSKQDEVGNEEFVRHLGAKGPRVKEIINSLVRGKLISIENSTEKAQTVKITDSGKAKLEEVNARLRPLLSGALQGRERSLTVASRHVRYLAKSLDAGHPARSKKRKQERAR